MRVDLLLLAADLARRREPFALATVVRREAPSSARVGDAALITRGGTCHGWVGGSCTQSGVVREALRALREGTPRLIVFSSGAEVADRTADAILPMTCQSGGSVDIYIEPVVPARRLVVFGVSPVAQALARVAKALGYSVDAVDPGADRATFPEADRICTSPEALQRDRQCAVVATMGHWDEEATIAALALEPAYLGLVASHRRFGQIRETLYERGADAEAIDRIKSPAGLDIGARSPEEIALSILAEIVQVGRSGEAAGATEDRIEEERDPVCGMTVAVGTAVHRAEFGGRSYYFCGAGCRTQFLAAPERYGAAEAGGTR
jgi:xanthine dehydrogenase accessory factor